MEAKFKYPTKEVCIYLASLDIAYHDMPSYFECKVSVDTMKKCFRKYRIPYKNFRERYAKRVMELTDKGYSAKRIAIKLGISYKSVYAIRKDVENGKYLVRKTKEE